MTSRFSEIIRAGGLLESGVLRFPDPLVDENVLAYRAIGGAHMTERSNVPFAMTSLDTPVLHEFLDQVAPVSLDSLIVDVGGGDGRNAIPWLKKGYRRVVVIDAAGAALVRLRKRIADSNPEWLDAVALIEADARDIPLNAGCADSIIASESLCYLNDDYEVGLKECVRILAPRGRILVSEHDREGALMMQLLYGGLDGMMRSYREKKVRDGPDQRHRTPSFSEAELREVLTRNGLEVLLVAGTSLLSVVLGWMNGRSMLPDGADEQIADVRFLLKELGRSGKMRRCQIAIAQHS